MCEAPLHKTERGVCIGCLLRLPQTFFWRNPKNNEGYYRLAALNPNLKGVVCGFWYTSGSPLRKWVQLAKYQGQPILLKVAATFLGQLILHEGQVPLQEVRGILPMPISPERLRQRGYNQAEWVARGLSEALKIPLLKGYWKRIHSTASQIGKVRTERWISLQGDFICEKKLPESVIVVDDVLTTGATLTAALHSLPSSTDVWIITVGITQRRS
ncbi:MAG: hypothetical protein RMJ66_08235 [Bacteroidia bacterium]|nr:hypothetical protein [Bacteroidia bacterium]